MKKVINEKEPQLPKDIVYIDSLPIDLHSNCYLFAYGRDVYKLMQYGKNAFTWCSIFNNSHFLLPNGRCETLKMAIDIVKHHNIVVFTVDRYNNNFIGHLEMMQFIMNTIGISTELLKNNPIT